MARFTNRSLVKVALTTAAIGTISFALTAPALADSSVTSDPAGATAHWKPAGDEMEACDTKADGYAALAMWEDIPTYSSIRYVWDTSGSGTCSGYTSYSWLPEGIKINLWACRGTASTGAYGDCDYISVSTS